MKEIIEVLIGKTHELILEEEDVLATLKVINNHQKWYINQKLSVGSCGWEDEPTKWAIYFNASNVQWSNIIYDLMNEGLSLIIKDYTGRIHLIRNEEASR